MANEIYKQTHQGLAEMISARAATNVLKKALKANACDADTVDYPRMRACLQGYVFEELRNVLPSHGLKRQIKGIIKDLRAISDSEIIDRSELLAEPQAETVAVEGIVEEAAMAVSEPYSFISAKTDVVAAKEIFAAAEPKTAVAEAESFVEAANYDAVFENAFDVIADENSEQELLIEDLDLQNADKNNKNSKYDDISDDLFDLPAKSQAVVKEKPVKVKEKAGSAEIQQSKKQFVRKKLRKSVDFSSRKLSDLEALVQTFTLVEGTRAVAIVHSSGKLVSSRGKGYDLDSLATLSNMALTLLKKSGDIRSFHLFVDESQLFLFPVGEHMIVVVGSEEINFGEIVSAFAAFEEEK